MKLEVKIEVLKFGFAVLNTIFLVLGLCVAGCGLWILFDTGSFLNALTSDDLQVVAAGMFLVGGVVVLVSVTGCVGASTEKRLLLLVYSGFIIILVLGQLFITVVLLIDSNKIGRRLNETVDQFITQYGNSSDSHDRLMDNMQRYAECCGRTKPDDWLRNSFIAGLNLTSPDVLPCSCFRSFDRSFDSPWCSENISFTEPLFGRGNGPFNESCSQKLAYWLKANIVTVIIMDVGLIVLQIIGISIAVGLYRAFIRKAALKRTNLLVNQAHADPDPDLDYGEQNDIFMDPDGAYKDYNNMGFIDSNQLAYQDYNQNQRQVFLQPVHNY
ncbi:CD82 antigen isoform 1-T2 [Odontesthes bonariensis]|uniref:CD82 antigen n=1 Tax=Odontesthes bonariensis TaxID=219752 RepID=UPI003F58322A